MSGSFLRLCATVAVGAVCSVFPKTYFHELGHVIAFRALFTDVSPSVRLTAFGGKCVSGGPCDKLTVLGKLFTKKTCHGIVTLSGPLFDLINAGATGMIGQITKQTHPMVSAAMSANALFVLVQVLVYAADFTPSSGHDFQTMAEIFNMPRKRFIHITALICTLAGPYLLSNFFAAADNLH